MKINANTKLPFWAVKKAKNSFTMYHFISIGKREVHDWDLNPNTIITSDAILTISFTNDFKNHKIKLDWADEIDYSKVIGNRSIFALKSLNTEKWVKSMSPYFKPLKSQSADDMFKANPSIRRNIILFVL